MRSAVHAGTLRRAVGLVVGVAALAAPGCARADLDAADPARSSTTTTVYGSDAAGIAASLVDHLTGPTANLNEWSPSEDQARCVAERLLARVSVDRLLAAGFRPETGSLAIDFDDDERGAVVSILVGCIDYPAAVLELLSAYEKVPLRVAGCVSRGVERLGLDRRLAEGLLLGAEPDPLDGDGELAAGLAALSVECTQPQDLSPSGPLPVQPGSGP